MSIRVQSTWITQSVSSSSRAASFSWNGLLCIDDFSSAGKREGYIPNTHADKTNASENRAKYFMMASPFYEEG